MRKFIITVNGKSYEVEVEEISQGGSAIPSVFTPVVAPTPAPTPTPAPAASAPTPAKSKPETETQPAPAPAPVPQGAETIKAPMPGTILSIKVKPGDRVSKGDVLLILEAMKMENEIMSPRDGKIVSVQVATGASVNAGDVLIAIE